MKRLLLTILGLAMAALPALAAPAASSEPAATWRLDYFHTGGLGDELFSVDRVVVEPLPWPGHPSGDVDPADLGSYRYRVLDAAGELLVQRGFGPIFAEWVTTAEAGEKHRTFHESVRFPAPSGPVTVAVDRRGGDGAFEEAWRTTVDPASIFVDRSLVGHQAPFAVHEIEIHGAARDKVDLLFVGDGYTAEECGAAFLPTARRLAAVLFGRQPFAARRDDWNLRALCPPAAESGVSRPSTGVHRRSPAGTTYDVFGSERYVLTMDNRALRDLAAWAPYDHLVILVNNDTYGGGGLFNLYATVAAGSDWADYLFIHEFGHSFAALADEYYTSPVAYQPPAEVREPWEPNVTALLPGEPLKWADLVAEETPLPTPWPKEVFEQHARGIQERRAEIRAEERPESEMSALFTAQQSFETQLLSDAAHAGHVGAFQGANYDAHAFYRPQTDCVMFSRDEVPFCAVCRRALERAIDLAAPPAGGGG